MATMIENINSIVQTKNDFGNILDENNVARPNSFSDYPDAIRGILINATYAGNLEERVDYLENEVNTIEDNLGYYATQSYVADYVYTYSGHVDLSAYATKSYVADYVATYAPQPDLSAYVTKTELSNAGYLTSVPSEYITDTELSGMSYATQTYVSDAIAAIPGVDLSAYATKSYVADYVNTYAPQPDLSAYVTKTQLSNASYVTQTSLSNNSYSTIAQVNAMFSYNTSTGVLTINTIS